MLLREWCSESVAVACKAVATVAAAMTSTPAADVCWCFMITHSVLRLRYLQVLSTGASTPVRTCSPNQLHFTVVQALQQVRLLALDAVQPQTDSPGIAATPCNPSNSTLRGFYCPVVATGYSLQQAACKLAPVVLLVHPLSITLHHYVVISTSNKAAAWHCIVCAAQAW
jgi:hypothetical protein